MDEPNNENHSARATLITARYLSQYKLLTWKPQLDGLECAVSRINYRQVDKKRADLPLQGSDSN